jgi:hypothetical protein
MPSTMRRRPCPAYRSPYHVEAAFRSMNNPYFVGGEPMHHWSDQKIRVPALYCVLALTLAGLLHREVCRARLKLSLEAALEQLSSIREVINLWTPCQATARQRPDLGLRRPSARGHYPHRGVAPQFPPRRFVSLEHLNKLKAC